MKVIENSIPYKKLSGRACLSPHRVEIGVSKNYRIKNIIMYWNGIINWIEFSTTFIWSFFPYNTYFWQQWAFKSIYFPISVHNILNVAIFRGPKLHFRVRDICVHWVSCRKILNNFYFNLFFILIDISGSIEFLSDLFSCFSILKYFKQGNPSNSLVPLWGGDWHACPLSFL